MNNIFPIECLDDVIEYISNTKHPMQRNPELGIIYSHQYTVKCASGLIYILLSFSASFPSSPAEETEHIIPLEDWAHLLEYDETSKVSDVVFSIMENMNNDKWNSLLVGTINDSDQFVAKEISFKRRILKDGRLSYAITKGLSMESKFVNFYNKEEKVKNVIEDLSIRALTDDQMEGDL